MSKPLVAFPWYGGKFYMKEYLIKHFPKSSKHYAEVFGGSCVILLNLKTPYPAETINDIDSEIINFFSVLRNNTDELILKLELSPYAREEHKRATPNHTDPVERARRFYVRVRQSINSAPNNGSWSYCVNKIGGFNSKRWQNSFKKLLAVARRLQTVQIENQDAIQFIDRYDTPQTFFYCDPPYLHDSRVALKAYEYEMTNEQHVALGERLNSIEGKAMVSGFRSKLYDELFAGWECKEFKASNRSAFVKELKRTQNTEVIWTNYPLEQKGRLL